MIMIFDSERESRSARHRESRECERELIDMAVRLEMGSPGDPAAIAELLRAAEAVIHELLLDAEALLEALDQAARRLDQLHGGRPVARQWPRIGP